MTDTKLLIGGELVPGDMTMDVVNPATGEPFTTVPRASAAQADKAIAAAKAAVSGWSAVPFAERSRKLVELADAIAARKDEFARTLTLEQGKPLAEAQGELAWTEGYLRHYATLELPDRVIQDDAEGYIAVKHKPLGVVVGIIAWNFPLLVACWKIGPAVLAGNAIVLKPAPTTPVAALMLGELCRDIFPAGVVNVITDANDLGPHLTSHPDVAKIGFTGSTATGKRIAATGADTLKRVTLELGGNDPAIVLPDADVAAIAEKLFWAAFANNGQICIATKRMYVHEDIYDALKAALVAYAATVKIGDGSEQGTRLGPINNRAQYERVLDLIRDAKERGYTFLTGGDAAEVPGYFIPVTIIDNPPEDSRIVQEEQFGPVLPLLKFRDVDDAIARANASDYGLGASVWGGDEDAAFAVAERIASGTVWVNETQHLSPLAAFGGIKQSGVGIEGGVDGLLEYTNVKTLVRRH